MGFLNRFLSGISSGDKFAKDCQKLGRPKVRRIVCFNTPPYFLTLFKRKTLTRAILGLQTVVKISDVQKSAQFGYNFWKYILLGKLGTFAVQVMLSEYQCKFDDLMIFLKCCQKIGLRTKVGRM